MDRVTPAGPANPRATGDPTAAIPDDQWIGSEARELREAGTYGRGAAAIHSAHSAHVCSKCTDEAQIARRSAARERRNAAKARACRLPNRAAVAESTASARARLDRFVALSELPIAALALLVAPTLVVEGHAGTAAVRALAHAVNWTIWLTFCVAYAVKMIL